MRATPLAPPTPTFAPAERADAHEAPDVAREGAVLAGKYKVERVIGSGGMGLVLSARHLSLGERVAVKLLLPRARSRSDAVARFLREGRAAARIRNEHVARVLDAGTLEGGEPFLVLEYLRGRDLRSEGLANGPLSVEDAVSYVLHACEGLAEAHAHGIVHRDLKPANLFLTRGADGSRLVKIIDFGVSKLECPETGDLTESDVAIGTPHYMAPEQMRAARDADPRADIFSLGAVLFWLLTGTLPFPGESMVAIYDRQREGPPSLSARSPAAPAELSAIVERCLRLSPDDRYPDVGVLAAALAPFAAPWARASAERARRITEERPPMSMRTSEDVDSVDAFEATALADAPPGAGVTQPARDPTWHTGSGELTPTEAEREVPSLDRGGAALDAREVPSLDRRGAALDAREVASLDGATAGVLAEEEGSPHAVRRPSGNAAWSRLRPLIAAGAAAAGIAAAIVLATRSPAPTEPRASDAAGPPFGASVSVSGPQPLPPSPAPGTATAKGSLPISSSAPPVAATGSGAPSARVTARAASAPAPSATPRAASAGPTATSTATSPPRPWAPGPMDTPD